MAAPLIHSVWPIGVIDIYADHLEIRNRTYSRTMRWVSDAERARWEDWLKRRLQERAGR